MPDQAPSGDASRLGHDWRDRIPADVEALAVAWHDPAAWTGMTKAGPVEMPGEIGGLVALDEIVIHGWDLAAPPPPFAVDDPRSQACSVRRHVLGPGTEDQRTGPSARSSSAGRRAVARSDPRHRRSRRVVDAARGRVTTARARCPFGQRRPPDRSW